MSELLRIDNISYSYHSLEGETPALVDVSFHVNDGEFVGIVGPSGCGKSTLLSNRRLAYSKQRFNIYKRQRH